MRIAIFGLFVILVVTVSAPFAGAQTGLTWKVVRYDVECELPSNYVDVRSMKCLAAIEVKNQSSRPFGTVSLRINEKAKIDSALSNGQKAEFTLGLEKINERQNLQKVQLRIPSVASNASATVVLNYSLPVASNSGIEALSPAGSQFLPFSYWYPTPTSWYYPGGGDFAPFALRVKGLGGKQLISAGKASGEGYQNPLVGQPFFLTGDWQKESLEGVEVYAPKGTTVIAGRAKEIAGLAKKALDYVTAKTGASISVPIRVVAVDRGSGFSDSGVVLVEKGAFLSPKLDSTTSMSIVESIAKTIYGNVVEVRGQGYGVIREGLPRHIGNRFVADTYGPEFSKVHRQKQVSIYSTISQKDGPLIQATPVDPYFYTSAANKGAMVWGLLENKYGSDMYRIFSAESSDGDLTIKEVRDSFQAEKEFFEYALDKVTEMNLMVGIPQKAGSETKAVLRNTGEFDAKVRVAGLDSSGKEHSKEVTIPAGKFSEVVFDSPDIKSVVVDADRVYPQTDYLDDFAPREITDNDPVVFVKREFDKQNPDKPDYAPSIENARIVLAKYPQYDDVRAILGRAYLESGKNDLAKSEFEKLIASPFSSSQSISWATAGLGEIAVRSGDKARGGELLGQSVRMGLDYSSALFARTRRTEAGVRPAASNEVKAFFAEFDKAVVSKSKAEIEAHVVPGEITRFVLNLSGQGQQWNTDVLGMDVIDENTVIVETAMSVKILNRQPETGPAVYKLTKVGGEYRLFSVERFDLN
ncbi:MAG: hypothetical protein R2684_06325 [Pyrinomonadaceae bacterium]